MLNILQPLFLKTPNILSRCCEFEKWLDKCKPAIRIMQTVTSPPSQSVTNSSIKGETIEPGRVESSQADSAL